MRTKRRAFLVHLPVLNFNRFDWICMTILQHINRHFISYCLHTKLRFWFGFNIKKPSSRETWWCLWTFVSKVRRGEKMMNLPTTLYFSILCKNIFWQFTGLFTRVLGTFRAKNSIIKIRFEVIWMKENDPKVIKIYWTISPPESLRFAPH